MYFINENGYSVADKMQVSPLTEGGSTYEFRLAYELNGSKVGKTEEEKEPRKFEDLFDDKGNLK